MANPTLPLPATPSPGRQRPVVPGERQRPRPPRGQLRMVFDRAAMHRNRRTREVAPTIVSRAEKVRLHVVNGNAVGRRTWCEDYEIALRPRYRWQCADVPRPCPYVGCEYHLYLDVERDGSLRLNFPDVEPDELRWDCALDLAEEGKADPAELARRVNLSREGFRKEYRATMGKCAELMGAALGERVPELNDKRADAPEPEMGEVGDIEW